MVAGSGLPSRFGRLIKWSCSFYRECYAHFVNIMLHDNLQRHPSTANPEGEVSMEGRWSCNTSDKRRLNGGRPRGSERASDND